MIKLTIKNPFGKLIKMKGTGGNKSLWLAWIESQGWEVVKVEYR